MEHEKLLHLLAAELARQPRASMEKLATAVGVSRATLSRKFATRDEMLNALAAQAVLEYALALERSRIEEDTAEEAIRRIVGNMLPSAELYRVLESPDCHDFPALDAWHPYKQKLLEMHYLWQERGELRVDLPAVWLYESIFILLRGAAAMVRNGQLARADAVNAVCTLLFAGIRRQS
ncbi:MAG: TetR family transcriptional regulator [Porticoccaceae bacterium]|jgi:AcrR family transcriptional regulator